MPFRLLEHTADMGLEVTAASGPELFAEVARALLMLLGGTPAALPAEERTIEIAAAESQELLINWLNELLFLLETRRFYLADVVIEELTPTRLRARLRGEPLDSGRHAFARDAKAATYHQLQLEERANGWYARIYLDL